MRSDERLGARLRRLIALLLIVGALGLLLVPVGPVGSVEGITSTPVNGQIHGPKVMGEGLSANFTVNASGGLENPDGSPAGSYLYNATLSGANATSGLVSPPSGVLLNGSASLVVKAPTVAQLLTLTVVVTSNGSGKSVSTPLSYSIEVVEPYVVNATLQVGAGPSVGPFVVTIFLDGTAVGGVRVPLLTANSTYPLVYDYVTLGLSPGWHTFSISLAQLHGQVTFTGGAQSFSQSFYVPGAPLDLTPWYVVGAVAFVGALFIWATLVGGRRRGRSKR